MSLALEQVLLGKRPGLEERALAFEAIHHQVLDNSRWMKSADFNTFHANDLAFMFDRYDSLIFGNAIRDALGGRPLTFRLSKRQTRSGGQTSWKRKRRVQPGEPAEEFEISVSSHLLFQTFRSETREIRVTGLPCENRLQAMQRIVEHEIVHLSELIVWQQSGCKKRRFQEIAEGLFGHLEHTHQLVTTRELAATNHGIRRGSLVIFQFEGLEYKGVVVKITKRATVLVPDGRGQLYNDGNRYLKYYVPISGLRAIPQ
ncbi:MAG: hypothetical protein JNL58_12915 [Planctomyces sp.]|nr:hypothetical protein [Planctomyces sp.]